MMRLASTPAPASLIELEAVPRSQGVFLLGRSRTLARLRVAIRQAQPSLYLAGEAATLTRGLQILRHCPCSVVALDLAFRGSAWLEQIRHCTDARVVTVAGPGDGEAVDRALGIGLHGVLCSADGSDALLRTVRRVLDGDVGLGDSAIGDLFLRAARRAATHEGVPRARLRGCDGPLSSI